MSVEAAARASLVREIEVAKDAIEATLDRLSQLRATARALRHQLYVREHAEALGAKRERHARARRRAS